ncbi:MAG TPA: transglycosylase SLT domain-containing protein [Gemmatimonadaceae bacterium]|nr:transglycosylase SLT domain-containing protein [Gemmatimonadaceae bacterium]
MAVRSTLRLVVIGVVAAATVVFTADRVKPIFLDESLVTRVDVPSATSDEKAMLLAPWSRLPFHEALATPIFLRDRSAFAVDLMGTGKVGLARALALADVAVREAYRRRVPPALVLGVLLTENDELKSTARSRQGAIGLMQIHPGPWRGALGELFGRNLRNDTTNLRYGIYILSHFAKRTMRREMEGSALESTLPWRTALLRYNGCVHGRNTKDCGRYPDMVRREVQRSAQTICNGRDFEGCVVTPLRLGARGE